MDGKLESWVIISAIILGLAGGIILIVLREPPITAAFFMALGASALVFKFLGGIPPDSTFTTKWAKLSGTAAVLIILTLILNAQLAKQQSPDLDKLFIPQWRNWVAIDKDTYCPVELQIGGIRVNGVNRIPAGSRVFDSKELSIVPTGNEFIIRPAQNSDLILGKLTKADLNKIKYYNLIANNRGELYTSGQLPAGAKNKAFKKFLTGEEMPFTISTLLYADNNSGYSLADRNGVEFLRGTLAVREGEVINWQNEFYAILVISADHRSEDENRRLTEFGAYKIDLR
jgi:hypothetical protein